MVHIFSCSIKTEGLLKLRGSHVHCKSGNISEMVQDKRRYYRSLIGKLFMAYQIALLLLMTVGDLQGYLPIASLSIFLQLCGG